MSEKNGRWYTSRFKFQVVMEILSGAKAIGQIARSYGVHPVNLTHWKKEFIEKEPEIFSQQKPIQEYEKRIENLERLIGHKEVEIALLIVPKGRVPCACPWVNETTAIRYNT